jgi:hypothetical protein
MEPILQSHFLGPHRLLQIFELHAKRKATWLFARMRLKFLYVITLLCAKYKATSFVFRDGRVWQLVVHTVD